MAIFVLQKEDTSPTLTKKRSIRDRQRQLNISPPMKHDNSVASWNTLHRSASLNYKFYNVKQTYNPTETSSDITHLDPNELRDSNGTPLIDHYLHVTKGSLVQKISDMGDGMWYVKPINELVCGLVPASYLEEEKQLNCTLSAKPHAAKWITSLIDLTPPTSPSTIVSKTFSKASYSRKTSLSIESPRSKQDSFLAVKLITKCEVESIELKDNRLEYTVRIQDSEGNTKVKHIYYSAFYKLHTKLMAGLKENMSLPNIPAPSSNYAQEKVDESTKLDRLQMFNTYLTYLIDVIYDIKSPLHLQDTFTNWVNDIEPSSANQHIKIKILFQGDYYALKCTKSEIDNLDKLHALLRSKIRALKDRTSLKMTAKLEGWYIVELTDEIMYRMILAKLNDIRRLAIDVSLVD
ncbi:uncharacterized protein CGFF_00375 [Nakaseomyces glabratus]|nr:hypothetical protein J6894_02441 [Nakaseomyces glabratus]QNG14522.1 uncharacterized protein GWK60_H08679 [Nakaseomyces glabratus]SCV12818.1 uncharacterized protein CGFF_00375 [Nakaseomyces glabratus]SLM10546.1 uncharacterized protein CGFF_00375 [Nakaseomyces glabratus]